MPVITYPALFTVAVPGASTVFRNGFQYTLLTRGDDIRRTPGVVIHDVLNSAPNSCSFTVDGESNVPLIGEKIEILDSEDGDRRLFAGTAVKVTQIYEGQPDQLAFQVQCVDFTWLMSKKRPFGSYNNISASDVVKDLISRFAPGYTTAHVQTNLAKVTANFDGSMTLPEALSAIAGAIGGGHWKVDYDQDVHFFHIPPPNVPPSEMPFLGAHLTLAAGALIPSTFTYDLGFYFFRHSFVYNDGTESQLKSISNMLRLEGNAQVALTGIPLGAAVGDKTVVARRIYVNRFLGPTPGALPGFQGGFPIESIEKYIQINDNSTTSVTSFYGLTGATDPAVVAIPVNAPIPDKAFTGHPDGPATAPSLSVNLLIQGDATYVAEGFTGDVWNGSWTQMKIACLYRDGSVSFPSPASNSAGINPMVKGYGIKGWNLTNLPLGPDISGNDVVARFFYYCMGISQNPNFSVSWPGSGPPFGFVWPVPFNEPDWAQSHVGATIGIIPDNTTTDFPNFGLSYLGAERDPNLHLMGQLAVGAGRGNFPYGNPNILSSDPIPTWPNPDGPNLEDVDPPGDLTDDNPDILHEDAGQAFTVDTDSTQVRNRIYVIGSGTISTVTADIGAISILVADISTMSPHGGTVRITDPGTGISFITTYSGLAGTTGATSIQLGKALSQKVAQGSTIHNFFQADDVDSQKFLAKAELDKDGAKTDGIHEFTIVDTSLKATFQLYMRAYAELELFARPIVSVRWSTRDPKTKAGQTIHVDSSNPPCQGDFLIQEVTIDQIRDEGEQLAPRYTATASSVRYELNDLLLQILGKNQFGSSVGGSSGGAGIAPAGALAQVSLSGAPQEVTVHLSSSQLKALNTSPLVVVPAPGAGKMLILLYAIMHVNEPAPFSTTNNWDLKYSTNGNTPTQAQNSITGAIGFLAGGVPENRWYQAVMDNAQFYDKDTPAVGEGDPTNKAFVLRASTDNVGDPTFINTATLKIVFFIIDAP